MIGPAGALLEKKKQWNFGLNSADKITIPEKIEEMKMICTSCTYLGHLPNLLPQGNPEPGQGGI